MRILGKAAGEPSTKNLEKIGRPILIETPIGRGMDRTEYFFFQCKKCGSVWTQYIDSGAGGHGRFWRKLTEGLF
jgi:hypothetical protein